MAQLARCCSSSETSELYRCFPAYSDHTGVFQRLLVVEADKSSQTGQTPAEPFRKEVWRSSLNICAGNLFAVALSDPSVGRCHKKEKVHRRHQALCGFSFVCSFKFHFLAAQERPHVQVWRGGLRKELLRAPEAAGSHEDSQRREALHLQGEELWQEVHHGWKPEEPPAHTHRWVAGKSRRWTRFY